MPYKPNKVVNNLSVELTVLRKELEATGILGTIDSSTLLVYSALKSGVTNSKEISECFFISEKTVNTQIIKLLPVKCRILKIYKESKTKFVRPNIKIDIHLLPNLMQEQVIEITDTTQEIPIVQIIEKPLDKKSKLRNLQI